MRQQGGLAPAELGFRMPAEWEPHAATWLIWPHKCDSWPGRFEQVPRIWAQVARAVGEGELVRILVNDDEHLESARTALESVSLSAERVRFYRVPTDDAWIRDSGPTFLTRRCGGRVELAAVGWQFNAWGGKYPPWDLDAAVAGEVAKKLGVPFFQPGIVLEGGSIDVNGCGAVVTTESCLLHPNRNPGLSRAEIECCLKAYLGVRHVLWLSGGIAGDDTDGHVDDVARFVGPRTVVAAVESDPSDENYGPLRENFERLRRSTDQDGQPLRVVPLPMPAPRFHDGQRLPASYANFYIANGVVLVPVFGDPNDTVATEALQGLFPDRRVIPIPALDLVVGLGAVHCITQQQPLADVP